jgi:hypothetical protein
LAASENLCPGASFCSQKYTPRHKAFVYSTSPECRSMMYITEFASHLPARGSRAGLSRSGPIGAHFRQNGAASV